MQSSIEKAAEVISSLPGIGKKSATRIAFFLLQQPESYVHRFLKTLDEFYTNMVLCPECGAPHGKDEACSLCSGNRDRSVICVVEQAPDAFIIENSGDYNGLYHILNGVLSPLDGIGPEEIRMGDLFRRIGNNPELSEIIVATNPSIEGNATANYIASVLRKQSSAGETGDSLKKIRISRIATGLAMGSQIEYADSLVISQAIRSRTQL